MPVREITAILVSWNDAEDLREAVRSLAEARCRMPEGGPRVSLFVVDNGGGIGGHVFDRGLGQIRDAQLGNGDGRACRKRQLLVETPALVPGNRGQRRWLVHVVVLVKPFVSLLVNCSCSE